MKRVASIYKTPNDATQALKSLLGELKDRDITHKVDKARNSLEWNNRTIHFICEDRIDYMRGLYWDYALIHADIPGKLVQDVIEPTLWVKGGKLKVRR